MVSPLPHPALVALGEEVWEGVEVGVGVGVVGGLREDWDLWVGEREGVVEREREGGGLLDTDTEEDTLGVEPPPSGRCWGDPVGRPPVDDWVRVPPLLMEGDGRGEALVVLLPPLGVPVPPPPPSVPLGEVDAVGRRSVGVALCAAFCDTTGLRVVDVDWEALVVGKGSERRGVRELESVARPLGEVGGEGEEVEEGKGEEEKCGEGEREVEDEGDLEG